MSIMITKLIILAGHFLDHNSIKPRIGGVETYMNNLAIMASSQGAEVVIYDVCPKTPLLQRIRLNDYYVEFYQIDHKIKISDYQKAFDRVFQEENGPNVVFVISTDQLNVHSKAPNVIQIQHGVSFDSVGYEGNNVIRKNPFLQRVFKLWICSIQSNMLHHTRNTVCVDYNYFNWFRTQDVIYPEYKVRVIPNYASSSITREELDQKIQNRPTVKRIVFARRFVKYRGVLLFADLIEHFIRSGIIADFTFAGDGPYENELKERFKDVNNVHFTKFSASDSIDFHRNFDIAIVPTIYSEGTSLSLLEAMAAGCYPLCTHVGGMTNIILDGYNGTMCYPDLESVCQSLKSILSLPIDRFNEIVINAYMSCTTAFSKSKWEGKWWTVLNSVIK